MRMTVFRFLQMLRHAISTKMILLVISKETKKVMSLFLKLRMVPLKIPKIDQLIKEVT